MGWVMERSAFFTPRSRTGLPAPIPSTWIIIFKLSFPKRVPRKSLHPSLPPFLILTRCLFRLSVQRHKGREGNPRWVNVSASDLPVSS